MKRIIFLVALSLFPGHSFSQPAAGWLRSSTSNHKHFEIRVKPFIDLYFFVYKVSSGSVTPPAIEGLDQAVAAARQVPIFLPLINKLALFRCNNAADAERAFGQFPENFKTRTGGMIPLRERAVHLARTLAVIERAFLQKVWPQHKAAIRQAKLRIARDLEPKEQELFAYFTGHLGFENADYVVPIYLVAEGPWPAALTANSDGRKHGACLVNVGDSQGAHLFDAILHESIHALNLETEGNGNVLVDLRRRLLEAGFDKNDLIVREGPHMLVFIQSVETVRRFLDASYLPYTEGVFARPGIKPLINAELSIWTAYLDGKSSREDALNQIVNEFIKTRKDAPAKDQD
ncbi:MAG: hypothetical protein QOH42_596 [Blastocatellia bacterium]|nr:hypothetical protein [Blastocatellia bacterium]